MSCFYVSNILTIFFLQATYFRYNKICIIPTLVFKPQISIVGKKVIFIFENLDNKALISRIQKWKHRRPSQTLAPDYDLLQAAMYLVQKHNIELHPHHVKFTKIQI